jgi:hypothetical protein
VTLNAGGTAPFAFTTVAPIPGGVAINATATDANGNTSEVSLPVTYYNTPAGSPRVVTLIDSNGIVYGTATFANVTGTGNTYTTHPFSPPVLCRGTRSQIQRSPELFWRDDRRVVHGRCRRLSQLR